MSNIGFAVDLPFSEDGVPSIQSLEAVRVAGFDFVIWHSNLQEDAVEACGFLDTVGLKPIALSVPGLEFLTHSQEYLPIIAAFRVPDVILRFDANALAESHAREELSEQFKKIATSDAYKNLRLLVGMQNAPNQSLPNNFLGQFPSALFMLDTFAIAQDPQANIAAMVRSLPDRCPLLVVQDIELENMQRCALGEGRLDWDAIFDAAEEASVEWYVCRAQDAGSGLAQARKSLEYLTERG